MADGGSQTAAAGRAPTLDAEAILSALGLESGLRFDELIGRNLFTRSSKEERCALFELAQLLLAEGGAISIAQIVPAAAQRLSSYLDQGGLAPAAGGLLERFAAAEERAYLDPANPLVSWTASDLASAAGQAGLTSVRVETERYVERRRIGEREIGSWLSPESAYGRHLATLLSSDEISMVEARLRDRLLGRELDWVTTVAFVSARRV